MLNISKARKLNPLNLPLNFSPNSNSSYMIIRKVRKINKINDHQGKNSVIFYQIISTNSLKKCVEVG